MSNKLLEEITDIVESNDTGVLHLSREDYKASAELIAEKCCKAACEAVCEALKNKSCLGPFGAEEAIRKAFGIDE